jgi:ribose 1,5-bisphosphokinase PhnN
MEQMKTDNTTLIKEKLQVKPAIIAVSGPSGAGKDYLTDRARESFAEKGIPFFNVQMVTERPHRGAVETKKCISPAEYDELVAKGELLGNHVNSVRYGYLLSDFKNAVDASSEQGGVVVIELNPSKQKDFPNELEEKLGKDLTAWIGVETTEEQTRANMTERGEAPDAIEKRISIMNEFFEAMEANPMIKIVDNGPANRANAGKDFIEIVEKSILEDTPEN